MADVLNRTTRQYLKSVNTPDYPPAEWIINPDMSPVEGVPNRYWIITGDVVSEMSTGEKAIVDLALLEARRDSIIARLDELEALDRQLVIMEVCEFNKLRQWLVNFQAAVAAAGNLGQLQASVAALPTLNDITFAQVKAQLRDSLGA